ncbi:hypothetical protein SISNIDRAFT_37371 [Sistotremastrum niveocremeum HHB9708]|uniref:Uncharacterized protein n=1 Tax=Sistotremastrum niveocremeum HHB9708 TaxID=1314777 RepID=A0A164VNE0_9AGAM|nr:hypothetical protein SISNIDRAFT_37371 [Sistotremastrum niveocremeum HHB9708]
MRTIGAPPCERTPLGLSKQGHLPRMTSPGIQTNMYVIYNYLSHAISYRATQKRSIRIYGQSTIRFRLPSQSLQR